ncbi:solute carrier family 35 member C2 [Cephus cinctus]|uniref:Solute carrier family 35 member C2 n=1 Tax=Cephus cinctus TaxID=211228 RepID=A0AAJ7CD83_CEPCN|nr:solute carrier family 35 member C2 [Cephus cinctus]
MQEVMFTQAPRFYAAYNSNLRLFYGKNMPRSNVKYEIANQDADTSDYFLSHVQEFQNSTTMQTSFSRKILQTILLISLYFVLSIGLTFYQKWVLKSYGFDYPLGVVVCHLVTKFLLATLVRCIRKCCCGKHPVRLPWQTIIWSLGAPGIASGLDIGFSNWAISLITVFLYTMTKSTTIIFILGFALLFKLERKSCSLLGIVVMISGGLMMFTYKSTQFHILGFLLCLFASFSSGLRWTMAQIIMQRSKLGLGNPVDMMYYMQPWMLLAVLPNALWFEGSKIYTGLVNTDWNDSETVGLTFIIVLGGAILAFCMEVAEFLVVTHTSSLTLSVSGIFKEICTLFLAYEWEGDQMSGLNFIGLLMCLGGIVLHVIQKLLISKKQTIDDLELQSNSVTTNGTKSEDQIDINLPLLNQKSRSLTNVLNNYSSSDEEEEAKPEDTSLDDLLNILQRREQ